MVNNARREYPTLRFSAQSTEFRQLAYGSNTEHGEKVLLTRASQWAGVLYVMWFHVMGVLSHNSRQSWFPFSLIPTTQASIRRVPDPVFVQPWEQEFVS